MVLGPPYISTGRTPGTSRIPVGVSTDSL